MNTEHMCSPPLQPTLLNPSSATTPPGKPELPRPPLLTYTLASSFRNYLYTSSLSVKHCMLEPLDHMLPRAETTLLSEHPENSDKDIDGSDFQKQGYTNDCLLWWDWAYPRTQKKHTYTHVILCGCTQIHTESMCKPSPLYIPGSCRPSLCLGVSAQPWTTPSLTQQPSGHLHLNPLLLRFHLPSGG